MKVNQLLYIEDELLEFSEKYGDAGEYINIKSAYKDYHISKKFSEITSIDGKKLKQKIVFYTQGSCRNALEDKNNLSSVINTDMKHIEKINKIVDNMYHLKKYYTKNQNEYGEYNENKIYNKSSQ